MVSENRQEISPKFSSKTLRQNLEFVDINLIPILSKFPFPDIGNIAQDNKRLKSMISLMRPGMGLKDGDVFFC